MDEKITEPQRTFRCDRGHYIRAALKPETCPDCGSATLKESLREPTTEGETAQRLRG